MAEESKVRKVTFLRGGLAQHIPLVIAYGFCIAFAIFFIDRVEKIRFVAAAGEELQQGALSQEVFDGVKAAITGANALDSVLTIVVVAAFFWASLNTVYLINSMIG